MSIKFSTNIVLQDLGRVTAARGSILMAPTMITTRFLQTIDVKLYVTKKIQSIL